MTLYLWIREYIKKYSFITKTEFKNATLRIYYEKDGKLKNKHLPYRASRDQLISCIESIKNDINYYAIKEARIKAGQYKVDDDENGFNVGITL